MKDLLYLCCVFFSVFSPCKLGNICRQGSISKNFLKLWKFSLRGVSILLYYFIKYCFCIYFSGILFHLCRSNGSGGDENRAVGEVVQRCGLCQDSDMVLKRNRVMIYKFTFMENYVFQVNKS